MVGLNVTKSPQNHHGAPLLIGGEGVENTLIEMMLQKKFKNTHMKRHL
jgi:hypothetical protein